MKNILIALVIAMALVQQPSAPPPASSLQERAYRANNRGVALLEQFNYDSAADAFREALTVFPDLAIARVNLSIALFYASKNTEAADAARAAVAALPESPTSHYVAGLIAKSDNRLDEATPAFERVLALDPNDAGAKIQLGQIRTQERRYDVAIRLFTDALAAEPYNVTAAYSLALALTRAGRSEEGRQAMQRFDTLRSSAYGVTYAQVYLSQGRYAEGLTSSGLERALVNPAPPAVTFADAAARFLAAPARSTSPAAHGRVSLFDLAGIGNLDILDIGPRGLHVFRRKGPAFAEITQSAGLGRVAIESGEGVIAGDYDNDGRADLLLFGATGYILLHQAPNGRFENATATAGLSRPPWRIVSAAFVDIDHDGDLDVVGAGTGLQVLRNNGSGHPFTDITSAAGLAAPLGGGAVALAPTDFDNRRDIDLIVAGGGRGTLLYRNMRDGTFRDASLDASLPSVEAVTSMAIGDVNKDGYPDLFFGRHASGTLALSNGKGEFRTSSIPGEADASLAAQFVDYDNDGLLDLFTLSDDRARVFRNTGDSWTETTAGARLSALTPTAGTSFQSLAIGDVDGDGDDDVVVRESSGHLRVWRNEGGDEHPSLRVRLAGRVSNRSGLGAKLDVRAGSLRQTFETASASPAVAPADIVLGLGFRTEADAVRVVWPSGILQAETLAPPGPTRAPLTITELDRKPSSCPYLFTWNGTRFEFVTDFMGGGEMGDWVSPSAWNQPDPDEYVRIRGDQLKPHDGRYELRITNELEEALFVDRLQLVAIDHPTDVEVFPNEGLRQSPRDPFTLIAIRAARPPVKAFNERGYDVRTRVSTLDRRYADDFSVLPIRGYAAPHTLTLDLGAGSAKPVLLLTGWTDYAFSNDNVAASQAGIEMASPSLQVRDSAGAWRTVISDLGFPVGRPQTIAVKLAGKFLSQSHEVRILTSMRIYWDQIQVADEDSPGSTTLTRLDPVSADLHWRGFSREVSPDGREPFGYDYADVSRASRWKALVGRYTREGDVRALVSHLDDMFVVSRTGDEIALSFDVGALPALAPGSTRTFLLYAHGYSKEMNPRSASPDTVGPLPFRAMTSYPYGPDEHYPDTPPYRAYLEEYNTRVVSRPLPNW